MAKGLTDPQDTWPAEGGMGGVLREVGNAEPAGTSAERRNV